MIYMRFVLNRFGCYCTFGEYFFIYSLGNNVDRGETIYVSPVLATCRGRGQPLGSTSSMGFPISVL